MERRRRAGRGRGGDAVLAIGALGVVYGDIGTNPLFAMREAFEARHHVELFEANVLGLLSVMFWSLVIVICVKYLGLVMRADNDGEGGILALSALATGKEPAAKGRRWLFVLIGLFGAALLYGDGVITPAISVLAAVEGTTVATDRFDAFVIPAAIVILIGLFFVQRKGTAAIGRVFGPVRSSGSPRSPCSAPTGSGRSRTCSAPSGPATQCSSSPTTGPAGSWCSVP